MPEYSSLIPPDYITTHEDALVALSSSHPDNVFLQLLRGVNVMNLVSGRLITAHLGY